MVQPVEYGIVEMRNWSGDMDMEEIVSFVFCLIPDPLGMDEVLFS